MVHNTGQRFIIITCRFRSKLTDTYGEAQKPIVYCGRGRPPKRALLNVASGGMVCYLASTVSLLYTLDLALRQAIFTIVKVCVILHHNYTYTCIIMLYHIVGIFSGGKYSFFQQQINFRAFYFRFCFISTIL